MTELIMPKRVICAVWAYSNEPFCPVVCALSFRGYEM